MTEKQAANDKKSATTTIIGIASVIWLLTCVWLFWIAAPCDVTQTGWYARKVSCLASNEMGDSLAGAFAPLAFLWLIAAVFLQRNELSAQRQELRESREVAQAQVVEARNNVAFMAKQTQLLQGREEFERKANLDEDFRDYIEALNDFVESSFKTILIATRENDGFGSEGDYPVVTLNSSDTQYIFKRLQAYSEKISECSIEAYRVAETGRRIRYRGIEELKSIESHLLVLSKKAEAVSDPLQIRFQIINADNAAWRIGVLVNLLEGSGELIPEIDY
ncbi:hypothetical protein [Devosia sp.]|uniref:hypothetical protein n=1 Tax=Devosia sp. TaxID=1871048 RepID=UPI0027357C37|nr:hypothetical protein [Devosia sp.]MDP2780278.1 hypothetical protein [Devosia sp.]